MKPHDFKEQLEYSDDLSAETEWEAFYLKVWPTAVSIHRIQGNNLWQKSGVDRVVYLSNRSCFLIDEKKRRKDYGDVLLEVWSVWYEAGSTKNKIGWTFDDSKICDFIAYSVPGKVYLLPFDVLRRAAKANLSEWIKRYRYPLTAKNNGYETRNVAIPWPVLRDAMNKAMVVRDASVDMATAKP
uniref:Uncharacterized protein n=1 Tax=viral metagenome TaxID=1070528 RepID=A0A6M3J7C3_9ZZZZ